MSDIFTVLEREELDALQRLMAVPEKLTPTQRAEGLADLQHIRVRLEGMDLAGLPEERQLELGFARSELAALEDKFRI
jgi:hypothetical protein